MSDWIEWTGGENPVPGKMVDLQFLGYDAVRTPPYIRPWEMHDQEADLCAWKHRGDRNDIIAYRLASPPADQPADHIGEGDEAAAVERVKEERIGAIEEFILWHVKGHPGHKPDIYGEEAAAEIIYERCMKPLLSLIARQQETIRADGECLTEIADPASPWDSTGEPLAYRISMDLTRRTELARARLSAHQPKEPK